MAFAPHTNDMVNESNNLPKILGSFRETEYKNYFEYAENNTGLFPEYPHIVYIGGDCGYRFANVKKTVAYILIDESIDDKWKIQQHRQYYPV